MVHWAEFAGSRSNWIESVSNWPHESRPWVGFGAIPSAEPNRECDVISPLPQAEASRIELAADEWVYPFRERVTTHRFAYFSISPSLAQSSLSPSLFLSDTDSI